MKKDNGVFCILPWIHAQVRQNGDVYPCCRVIHRFSYGSTTEKTLDQIWNSEEAKKVRREMRAGVPQSFCTDCYRIEKLGNTSHRQHMNEAFKHEMPRLEATDETGHLSAGEIVYLDIRFSNVCNFKCRSCSPDSSSSWYEDHKIVYADVPYKDPKVRRISVESQTIMADIDRLLPKIQKIYFAGGEPLLDENHYRLLEKLIELGRTDVILIYNTNISHLSYRHWNVLPLWQKFTNIQVCASIDAIGAPLELIRKGANWETTRKNLNLIMAFSPNVRIQIYPTVSIMNCFLMPELIESFLDQKIIGIVRSFEINIMNDPQFLSVAMMKPEEIDVLERQYEAFLKRVRGRVTPEFWEHLRTELERVVKYARSFDLPGARKMFQSFTFKLDRIRKERTVSVIPQLLDILYGPA